MQNPYGVVEVICLETKEIRLIKLDRFNPALHKMAGQPYELDRKMDYDLPIHIQKDALSAAVAKGDKKRLEDKQQKEEKSLDSAKNQEQAISDEPKLEFDPAVDLTPEKLENIKFNDLKKYAKHRGIKTPFGLGKKSLMALLAQIVNSN